MSRPCLSLISLLLICPVLYGQSDRPVAPEQPQPSSNQSLSIDDEPAGEANSAVVRTTDTGVVASRSFETPVEKTESTRSRTPTLLGRKRVSLEGDSVPVAPVTPWYRTTFGSL